MAHISEVFVGARFGRLTVVGERTAERRSRVAVRCDCGTEKMVLPQNLGRDTRSCGCLARETATRHGMSYSPEYKAWESMIRRCTSPKCADWPHYGGRGITVHAAWLTSFEAFYGEIGPRPSIDHSLDRIDNNGNYEPGNVRWATRSQQMSNQKRSLTCPRGHLRTEDNITVYADGFRRCKECQRLHHKAQNVRRRAERAASRQVAGRS